MIWSGSTGLGVVNDAVAPLAGALNVTVWPGTGLEKLSVTSATSELVNAVATVADCGEPADTVIAGGVVMLLDPWTGERLSTEDGRTGSLGKWVGMHYWSLHTGWWGAPGSLLGWVGRILYMIIGIAPTVLFITGLGIWLNRRKQARVVAARRDSEATIPKPSSTIAEHSSVS